MGVSIVEAAKRAGLDLTAMQVGEHHLLVTSKCGRRLYRWDRFGERFVEQVDVIKKTINDSKRRLIRYAGHSGQRYRGD